MNQKKEYTQNDVNFIQHVKDECKRLGVKTKIRDVKYLKLTPRIRCGGYFESGNEGEAPVLAAAMNHEDGLAILAHEYCHMTQWDEKIPLWDIASESIERIDKWLGGEEIETIDSDIKMAIALELDNEKRTLKLIKKWGLDIDHDEYVQKSNAYLQFYLWMKKTRKWSKPGNGPYKNKKLYSAMSKKFDMNYHKLDPKIEVLFAEAKI